MGESISASLQPERVYHYTRMETAIEHILPRKQIRLGRYNQTNDPRENMNWTFEFTLGGPSTDREFSEKWNASSAEQERIQSCIRVFCCSCDEASPRHPEQRGYGRARMWAQYGGNHEGVCLVLNRERLHKAIEKTVPDQALLWDGKVEYCLLADRGTDAYDIDGNLVATIGHEKALLAHLRIHLQELLFVKSCDWRDEKEYRWAYLASFVDDDVYVPIEGCLEEIIITERFKWAYLPSLQSVCRGMKGLRGIKVLSQHHGRYKEPSSI